MKHAKYWLPCVVILALLVGGFAPAGAVQAGESPWKRPWLKIAEESNWKYAPAVAFNSVNDEYMVVWETIQPGDHHEIYGRRVTSTGYMYPIFLIYSGPYNSLQPSIAYDPIMNRYLVVWSYDYYGNGSDLDIYGRFVPWQGPIDAEQAFGIDTSRSSADKPVLAITQNPSPHYLIVWRVISEDGLTFSIEGGVIYNDKTGYPVVVYSGPNPVDFPDLAYNYAHNQFGVVWDEESGGDLDVYGARLDYAGQIIQNNIPLATSDLAEQHPAIAACFQEGQYLIAWQRWGSSPSDDGDIYGRLMNGSDGYLFPIQAIAGTSAPQRFPKLSCNYSGNTYYAVWQDMYNTGFFGIWAAEIHAPMIVDPPFDIIGPGNTKDNSFPAVIFGKSDALFSWEHGVENTNYLDIWGRIVAPNGVFLPVVDK